MSDTRLVREWFNYSQVKVDVIYKFRTGKIPLL
jgi:hypothetical protein